MGQSVNLYDLMRGGGETSWSPSLLKVPKIQCPAMTVSLGKSITEQREGDFVTFATVE